MDVPGGLYMCDAMDVSGHDLRSYCPWCLDEWCKEASDLQRPCPDEGEGLPRHGPGIRERFSGSDLLVKVVDDR